MNTPPLKRKSVQGKGIIYVLNALLAIYFLSVAAYVFKIIQYGVAGPYAVFTVLLPYAALILLLLCPPKESLRKILVLLNLYLSIELLLLMVYGIPWASATVIFIHMMMVVYLNFPRVRDIIRGVSAVMNVLIIDDDRGVHKTLVPVLTGAGFDVFSAFSGEEGMGMAQSVLPRLVILDVIMPKMKGREVCQKLKSDPKTKNITVIFLTAKDSPDDVQAEMHAGASGHLTKPVDPKKVLSEIRKVLEGGG